MSRRSCGYRLHPQCGSTVLFFYEYWRDGSCVFSVAVTGISLNTKLSVAEWNIPHCMYLYHKYDVIHISYSMRICGFQRRLFCYEGRNRIFNNIGIYTRIYNKWRIWTKHTFSEHVESYYIIVWWSIYLSHFIQSSLFAKIMKRLQQHLPYYAHCSGMLY